MVEPVRADPVLIVSIPSKPFATTVVRVAASVETSAPLVPTRVAAVPTVVVVKAKVFAKMKTSPAILPRSNKPGHVCRLQGGQMSICLSLSV